MRMAVYFDALDPRRAKQEGSFYTDTIAGDPAHCEVGIIAALLFANDGALEFLNAFVCTFFDP